MEVDREAGKISSSHAFRTSASMEGMTPAVRFREDLLVPEGEKHEPPRHSARSSLRGRRVAPKAEGCFEEIGPTALWKATCDLA